MLRYVRLRDPVGQQVHTALACLYLFLLPLQTAPKDILFVMLTGYALLRLPNTWRCYTVLLRDSVGWLMLAWLLWHAAAVLWSLDPAEGVKELRSHRIILTPLILWPVIDRLTWMVIALLIGVFGQNMVQLLQALRLFGFEPNQWGRLRGLIHPIHTGTFALAALLLCVSALCVLPWRGRSVRALLPFALALIGGLAALFGFIGAGSRGPWIAGLVALPCLFVLLMIHYPTARRRLLISAVPACIVMALLIIPLRGYLGDRVTDAVEQLEEAIEEEDFDSDVGLRIGLWRWAGRGFMEAPLFGMGSGSYALYVERTPEFIELAAERPPDRPAEAKTQPHSLYMHVLFSHGLVGALVAFPALLIVTVRLLRRRPESVFTCGLFAVMISWLVGTMFDSYNTSGAQFGLYGLLMAAALPWRPPPRTSRTPYDPDDEALLAGACGVDERSDC